MSDVLVYSGPGVSTSALHHTLKTLRQLLSTYDVKTVDARTLAQDPWQKGASMVVIPGGRDLPYVTELSRMYLREGDSSSGARADERIRDFVRSGGTYLGICAGAYYASTHCTFEKGTSMEVDGARPYLAFYPGPCQGTVYPGFVYESDRGARIIDIERTERDNQGRWRCHYNGGGAFMSSESYKGKGVEVLAKYCSLQPEELDLERLDTDDKTHLSKSVRPNYGGEAAVVLCSVDKGKALLFGTHPEFPLLPTSTPVLSAKNHPGEDSDRAAQEQELKEHEKKRLRWLHHLLSTRLGLRSDLPAWASELSSSIALTASEEQEPKLLPIFAASIDGTASASSDLVQIAEQVTEDEKGASFISNLGDKREIATLQKSWIGSVKDSNDAIHFYRAESQAVQKTFEWCRTADYAAFAKAILPESTENESTEASVEKEVDLDSVPKYMLICSRQDSLGSLELPDPALLPYWNISEYFQFLSHFREINGRRETRKEAGHWSTWRAPFDPFNPFGSTMSSVDTSYSFGSPMLYTQMVTSTQTMLDKNYRLLSALPVGTTFFATQQMSGRGRGGNRWISPKGCLQFSTVFRVPTTMAAKTVFLQYLSGLAVVEGIRLALGNTEAGRRVGEKVRIKWPNDVYAEVPAPDQNEDGRAKTATFELHGKRYAKLGGILVNSQFSGGKEFVLISGCGVNCLNPRPTTSVSDLIQMHNQSVSSPEECLPLVSQEKLAGAILSTFDSIWRCFMRHQGDFRPFVDKYRQIWLHSDQETTLTSDALRGGGNAGEEQRVRIVGISSDYGLLQAAPLTSSIRSTDAKAWGDTAESTTHGITQLQPDGNSFDMLQNLVKRKA